MNIKADDIRSKVDFINNHALKDTDYKIRTSKNIVYLNIRAIFAEYCQQFWTGKLCLYGSADTVIYEY